MGLSQHTQQEVELCLSPCADYNHTAGLMVTLGNRYDIKFSTTEGCLPLSLQVLLEARLPQLPTLTEGIQRHPLGDHAAGQSGTGLTDRSHTYFLRQAGVHELRG